MDLSVLHDFLHIDFLGQPSWLWILFMGIVFTLLFVDLFILNKKDHVIDLKESLRLSAFYVALGMLFGLWVWYQNGADNAADYYTVWLLEETLSMDNLFVMSIIFASFKVPREYQHSVLIWGILGVIVLRGLMIFAGAAIVHEYTWVLLIFAVILIFTGVKMMFIDSDDEEDYSQKPYVKFLAKYLRVLPHLHDNKFFVKTVGHAGGKRNVWHATPLFLCLCVIELTDVMFAFDSVPASLAVTTDPYIVYTANIFAILGLRALFFAIEHILNRFEYLKHSLSIILVFIGGKVFYNEFLGHIPGPVSLLITVAILAGGVIVSMLHTSKKEQAELDKK